MCGIAGKVDLTRPVEPELLARMCELLEHRGPDARGLHVQDGVGLGIQRLAVIDLETGDQPIYNEDRSVVVVLNGEIYNYVELRERLIERGHQFRTASDTETIVHLYEELGPRCVEQLRGMFAFAIWDEARRTLVLARDRVGKKPLFYRVAGDTLWFASEPRAILVDRDVPREIDSDAIDTFLRFAYVPHPLCAFGGLRKLAPAHVLEWSGGDPTLSRYWQLDYRTPEPRSLAEAAEIVRESVLEATKLRLRADVPLGAFLSGGVDSSAVVAAMSRTGPTPVKTFSIGFGERTFDETAYAREVAERYGTEHREFRVEPDAIAALPRLVWHYGEPFGDPSALPSFYLAELTRQHVTVALNGDGGDESFAGYERYVGQSELHRLDGLPEPVRRAIAACAGAIGARSGSRSSWGRALRATGTLAMAPPQRYDRWVSYFSRAELDRLYEPAFAGELPGVPTADRLIVGAWGGSAAPGVVDTMLDVDVRTYLPGDLLVKMDIATMAHSLEVRSPFLDHVLMERAAHLSDSLKLRGRTTKLLLKEAMRPWLPASVIERPKMGFGLPVAAWFRGALANLPEQVLLDPAARERRIFQPAGVRRLIDDHRLGAHDHAGKLWSLVCLELWFRTYIDGPGTEPVEM